MNKNFIIEILLILFAILASNGFIYSLTFFNLNKPNSSENISVITNCSENNGRITLLLASNPLRLTSSESSTSQTLTSSESNISEDIFDSEDLIDSDISGGLHTENSSLSNTNDANLSSNVDLLDHTTSLDSRTILNDANLSTNINVDVLDQTTSLDSITILNSQSIEQLRETVMILHDLPINTPAGILQQVKFEELNILYSQDIIYFGITQTELRLIIEHLPAISLFNPEINHLILTIMSYYHC
jgi:hypothetical protein